MVCPDVYLFGDEEAGQTKRITGVARQKLRESLIKHCLGNPRSTLGSHENGDLSGLMFWLEQVVDRFDGTKGANRNFHKDRKPLCHGSVP